LQKCTADIGKPNARGVDVEIWMPGQDKYRETHTADYMTDYQARRLKTCLRRMPKSLNKVVAVDDYVAPVTGIELVHTNDATAFALGRIMAVIIENYQTADGDILIPEVLKPYLPGKTQI
jgi:seryl-tRNA synthetase